MNTVRNKRFIIVLIVLSALAYVPIILLLDESLLVVSGNYVIGVENQADTDTTKTFQSVCDQLSTRANSSQVDIVEEERSGSYFTVGESLIARQMVDKWQTELITPSSFVYKDKSRKFKHTSQAGAEEGSNAASYYSIKYALKWFYSFWLANFPALRTQTAAYYSNLLTSDWQALAQKLSNQQQQQQQQPSIISVGEYRDIITIRRQVVCYDKSTSTNSEDVQALCSFKFWKRRIELKLVACFSAQNVSLIDGLWQDFYLAYISTSSIQLRYLISEMAAFAKAELLGDFAYFRLASELACLNINSASSNLAKFKVLLYHSLTVEVLPEISFGAIPTKHKQTSQSSDDTYYTLSTITKNVATIILGASKIITTKSNHKIGVQVDRVVRDWLSSRFESTPTHSALNLPIDKYINWHEGARLRDILSLQESLSHVRSSVIPLSSSIAVFREADRAWYSPDENAVFKFSVFEDKIKYPTTLVIGGAIALILDTHGIASLVPQAIESECSLVIGCGDSTGKMDAAKHLGNAGIDVYFPCDRYASQLLGDYDGPGVLLGSAPVTINGSNVVIGGTPIHILLNETIVLQNIARPYPAQYYDAPFRYFTRLRELLMRKHSSIRLGKWVTVKVDEEKQTSRVVTKAVEIGATVIACRVAYEEDYQPVADWLRLSNKHRAVLFHSAAYPPGVSLFSAFEGQVSFGDYKPLFF